MVKIIQMVEMNKLRNMRKVIEISLNTVALFKINDTIISWIYKKQNA